MNWKDLDKSHAKALIHEYGSIENGHAQLKKIKKSTRGDPAFPNRGLVEQLLEEKRLKKELGEVWD